MKNFLFLRLNVERLRLVTRKYNYLIEQMEREERDLFQWKLIEIDQVKLVFFLSRRHFHI